MTVSSPSTFDTIKANAVGDWQRCGDSFFRKELLYNFTWDDVNFQQKRLACCSFGGPIAVIRDERRAVLITGGAFGSGSLRPVIRFFNGAGSTTGAVVWDRGRILGWGWTSDVELVIVESNGRVSCWSPFGSKIREFTLGIH
eukprot:CAMPEP_0175042506 /NCGR_PEP_ID=MMETSP0052_2-20121109/2610_1 /TAXON_ID=51329 ORGANISM="Polytomella parva, Strain SAG 63-3" /NCGR_SAMPLE_ID=MMETSP0052_2 /ASSEMBLY_ACC=CAM_ASM_000194 /LENGTH=141 /DNA_ID=CAMNT_0016305343 /DNA_START=75 /DNA_END=497 /DNA_ORIENTATION=-